MIFVSEFNISIRWLVTVVPLVKTVSQRGVKITALVGLTAAIN